jgi:hypothetical protein
MADRNYYDDRDYYDDRERARGHDESRERFGRERSSESSWNDRNRDAGERGPMSRGADEVRSWFGDDDAQRRREMDEHRERSGNRQRSEFAEQGRSGMSDRSSGEGWRRDPDWSRSSFERGRSPVGGGASSQYGSWYGGRSRSDYGRPTSGFSGERWSGSMGQSTGQSQNARWGSFAGRGPRNYQRSDERIREEVNERLTDDHRVDASDIEVEVRNGEVILRGRVDERRDKRAAEEVVENLPGVRDVRNELRVERSSGWFGGGDRDQHDRRPEGSIGHTGDPQKRDDVTSLNLSGSASESASGAAASGSTREKSDKADRK